MNTTLINPSFHGVNRLHVLSFKNAAGRTSYTRCYLPLVEVKDYNVVTDGRITYGNIERLQLAQEIITQVGVY